MRDRKRLKIFAVLEALCAAFEGGATVCAIIDKSTLRAVEHSFVCGMFFICTLAFVFMIVGDKQDEKGDKND